MTTTFNRRQIIGTSIAATSMLMLPLRVRAELSKSTLPVAPFVEVEIASGKVRGGQSRGALAFKGVPYAGNVSGVNRFKVAPPVESWSGVFDATQLGPPAIQRPNQVYGEQEPAPSENCLVLNVWTPAVNDHRKRPVMLYLHGGGYIHGSAGSTAQDGSRLAATYDVVVVECNHRLGMMGYLYLGELDERYADSANAGMLDVVATLKWIKTNIEVFGGDPNNITVLGESGGGGKVGALMAMPQAVGLYHKAGIQSGAWLKRMNKSDATETSLRLLKALNIPSKELHRLADVPVQALLDLQNAGERNQGALSIPSDTSKPQPIVSEGQDPPGRFGPVVDGRVLPTHPFHPAATPLAAKIPLMLGVNRDEEMLSFRDKPEIFSMSADELTRRTRAAFGDKADRILAAYAKAMPQASPSDVFIAGATAVSFVKDTWALASIKSAQPAPVYLYRYDYESNVAIKGTNRTLQAAHASDIGATFYNFDLDGLHGNGPGVEQASRNLSALWTAFARSGVPVAKGVPAWSRYNTQSRPTMLISSECKLVNDPDGEVRRMWESL
jgi:para-nitrobenzyl esterase